MWNLMCLNHKEDQLLLNYHKVKATKAVINVTNNDNKCLMYAILSALHLQKDAQRQTKYRDFSIISTLTVMKK